MFPKSSYPRKPHYQQLTGSPEPHLTKTDLNKRLAILSYNPIVKIWLSSFLAPSIIAATIEVSIFKIWNVAFFETMSKELTRKRKSPEPSLGDAVNPELTCGNMRLHPNTVLGCTHLHTIVWSRHTHRNKETVSSWHQEPLGGRGSVENTR